VRCLVQYEQTAARMPLLKAMHDMTPEHVHEEIEIEDLDFASYGLEWLCSAPRWRGSLPVARPAAALRVPQDGAAGAPVAARPGPLGAQVAAAPRELGALVDTFPDATIAITHRDPVAVIQSAITMLAYGERVRRTRLDLPALAAYWIDRIERLLRALRARPRASAGRAERRRRLPRVHGRRARYGRHASTSGPGCR
jgi:hypothetical protein